jgi:hypothetical protein
MQRQTISAREVGVVLTAGIVLEESTYWDPAAVSKPVGFATRRNWQIVFPPWTDQSAALDFAIVRLIMNRELTPIEEQLIRWMLQHGKADARAFLPQLEKAQVTPFRCPCGCASINLSIDGLPEPSGGMHTLADFIFGTEEDLSGFFVFEQGGVLSGLEVYGFTDDSPKTLPSPHSLRPFPDAPPSSQNA